MKLGRGSHGLPRLTRIRSSRDYRAAAKSGRRVAGRDFILIELAGDRLGPKRGEVVTRLGITASRRVGNAVARNRVKRLVREWFRNHEKVRVADWVVIARPGASALQSREISNDLDDLVERLNRPAKETR